MKLCRLQRGSQGMLVIVPACLEGRHTLLQTSGIQASSRRLPPAAIVLDAGPEAGSGADSATAYAGNWACPLPPLVLWIMSVTVLPRTDVTCNSMKTAGLSSSAGSIQVAQPYSVIHHTLSKLKNR